AMNSAITTSLAIDPTNPLVMYAGGHAGTDAFVAKLDAGGDALVYSTYFGGAGPDSGNGIAVDTNGNAYLTGGTSSPDLQLQAALQANLQGGPGLGDAFVAKFTANGVALWYSSYFGGSGSDAGSGIALDQQGNPVVVGFTTSEDFPTIGAFQPAFGGGGLD